MSNLLLWRHAEAEAGNPRGDLARALTAHGADQATQGARWIRSLAAAHDWKLQVIASPAVRARQTARALVEDALTNPAIAPDADGASYLALATGLRHRRDALVLVGHQPSIGEAIAELLIGVPHAISVRKGVIWWFALRADALAGASASLRGVWSPD